MVIKKNASVSAAISSAGRLRCFDDRILFNTMMTVTNVYDNGSVRFTCRSLDKYNRDPRSIVIDRDNLSNNSHCYLSLGKNNGKNAVKAKSKPTEPSKFTTAIRRRQREAAARDRTPSDSERIAQESTGRSRSNTVVNNTAESKSEATKNNSGRPMSASMAGLVKQQDAYCSTRPRHNTMGGRPRPAVRRTRSITMASRGSTRLRRNTMVGRPRATTD